MIVTFRTDASLQIGSGHVMRCLTLAQALQAAGAQCQFICREHPGNMIAKILERGFAVIRLPVPLDTFTVQEPVGKGSSEYAAWLGADWATDAAQTKAALGEGPFDWLVVDHYAIEARWEQELRPIFRKLMVIDDLANRQHDCDLLLDQNLYRSMETRYDHLIPASCVKMLGPRFALLRPEFAVARQNLRQREGGIRRVLVSYGGVDATNETEKALRALIDLADPELVVDVVAGGGNLHKEQLQGICASQQGFTYHSMVDNMAELMGGADLAIGAGGSTTWERCALGLPSFVTVLSENQRELTESGAQQGLFYYLGASASVTARKILDALYFFATSPESLQLYTTRGLATVDTRGAQRVVSLLSPLQITIRRAVAEDCDPMNQWRNAEETRRFIFDDNPIPLEAHRSWFYRTLQDADRVLLVGEIDGRPVGVLRYDFSASEARISVYLVPGGQGKGVGSQLIRCGSRWIRENFPDIKSINAEIFKENVASLRAFESAGYQEHHAIYKETL